MKIKPFHTERFFAQYEFTAPYLLCASDCETMTIAELLTFAGRDHGALGSAALGYTESQGSPDLLASIADLYPTLNAGQIIGLGAPEEGIFITMHALLEPGDTVVVLSPCYDSLFNVAEYLGCRVIRWFLHEDPGGSGWQMDLAALQESLAQKPKLVIVNFPHNPTGFLPTLGQWQDLVALVRQAGAWLFSDEMYRGLEYDPATRLPSGCDEYERAITLGGLSKSYGLPGLRSGWLALHDRDLAQQLMGWKDYTTICSSAPSEVLAHIALTVGEELMARCRAIVTGNLARAEPFFARWQHLFDWQRPRAGSVALVGLKGNSAPEFCARLVSEQGVLLLPSTGLGIGDRHVRFGFGRRSFVQSLTQLDAYLDHGCSKVA